MTIKASVNSAGHENIIRKHNTSFAGLFIGNIIFGGGYAQQPQRQKILLPTIEIEMHRKRQEKLRDIQTHRN